MSGVIMFREGVVKISVHLLLQCVLHKFMGRPFSTYQIDHLRLMLGKKLTHMWSMF
jgi:hypothetical protein